MIKKHGLRRGSEGLGGKKKNERNWKKERYLQLRTQRRRREKGEKYGGKNAKGFQRNITAGFIACSSINDVCDSGRTGNPGTPQDLSEGIWARRFRFVVLRKGKELSFPFDERKISVAYVCMYVWCATLHVLSGRAESRGESNFDIWELWTRRNFWMTGMNEYGTFRDFRILALIF